MRSRVLALAAVLAAGVSVPALAAWDEIGTVSFGWRGDRETQWGNFGGPVERLNFRAERSGVNCRSVRATFRRGNTQEIFRGYIRRGRSVNVDLPGRDRHIRRLDFNCRSDGRREATLRIMADIGRYRGDWRRSPDWNSRWSRMFNWEVDVNIGDRDGRDGRWDDWFDTNQWVSLGRESFEGRGDNEVVFAGGWRGRSVEMLALKPLNGDARCWSVRATFDNGQTRSLNIDGGDMLSQGRTYRMDLPGGDRDLRRVSMTCRPVGDRQVTIELFARK